VRLLVDSTRLKLCGAGEWLVEKHGTQHRAVVEKVAPRPRCRTSEIVASALTDRDVDDACRSGPLLDQVAGAVASFIANGAYGHSKRPHTARPPPPVRGRARPRGLAAALRLQRARSRRGSHCVLETGDRGRAALAQGRVPGGRGGDRCPCPQPHAGVRTPDLCPHRLPPDGAGASAPALHVHAICRLTGTAYARCFGGNHHSLPRPTPGSPRSGAQHLSPGRSRVPRGRSAP
jgi:hypothetical protein